MASCSSWSLALSPCYSCLQVIAYSEPPPLPAVMKPVEDQEDSQEQGVVGVDEQGAVGGQAVAT